MTKKTVYEIKSLYRDDFCVTGYEFGSGEKSACIVGGCRGNEVQQLYTCSQIIRHLKQLEKKGKLNPGHRILVIPSMNPYSMNIQKRFWPIDNSDINRMFPGYSLGGRRRSGLRRVFLRKFRITGTACSLPAFTCRGISFPMSA